MSNKIFNEEKLSPIAGEIGKAMSKINSNSFKSTQEIIWEALINPTRAVEVRGWLTKTKNKEKALEMRGEQGETMLHWAVLSEYSLVIDLISIGLNPNIKDALGRTPMDWLVERFWYSIVKKEWDLPKKGLLRIRAQTIELGSVLWSKGGRPSDSPESLHAGEAWIRGDAWELLSILKDTEGLDGLRNWFVDKSTALHVWLLADISTEKDRQLENMLNWGLSIDELDVNYRSPLWYAIDTWVKYPEWEKIIENAIKTLLSKGADPDLEDIRGISPSMLLGFTERGREKAFILEEMIKEVAQQG